MLGVETLTIPRHILDSLKIIPCSASLVLCNNTLLAALQVSLVHCVA